MLWPRTLARSSLVLTVYGMASMLLLHAPRITREPQKEVEWFNLGEIATTEQIIDTLKGRSVGLGVEGSITRASRRSENAGI